jgi:hypothetical protein
MNKLLTIILLLSFYSCQNSRSFHHQARELPDQSIINDVILSVIRLDSLTLDHSLVRLLTPVKIYPIPYWPKDSTPVPPPPPGGFYYHHLLEILNSKNQIERNNDSIFLSIQSNRSGKVFIADSIFKMFVTGSNHIYHFKVPIFSFDKKRVYVEYWDNCGPLCGLCYGDLLNWTELGWTRIDQYHCGIR